MSPMLSTRTVHIRPWTRTISIRNIIAPQHSKFSPRKTFFFFQSCWPTRDHIGRSTRISNPAWHLPQVVPRVVQTTGSVHPQPILPNCQLCINTDPTTSIGPLIKYSPHGRPNAITDCYRNLQIDLQSRIEALRWAESHWAHPWHQLGGRKCRYWHNTGLPWAPGQVAQ